MSYERQRARDTASAGDNNVIDLQIRDKSNQVEELTHRLRAMR